MHDATKPASVIPFCKKRSGRRAQHRVVRFMTGHSSKTLEIPKGADANQLHLTAVRRKTKKRQREISPFMRTIALNAYAPTIFSGQKEKAVAER
jgi:hypothetical protein